MRRLEQILAADDMGNILQRIVMHHAKMIAGRLVAAGQHNVAKPLPVAIDPADILLVKAELAHLRQSPADIQAPGKILIQGHMGGALGEASVAAGARIVPFTIMRRAKDPGDIRAGEQKQGYSKPRASSACKALR